MLCTECRVRPARLDTRAQRDGARRRGRAYCSDACRAAWVRRDSSQRMATTNRRYASARMRARNPMFDPEARARMRVSLAGVSPAQRGGNGHGPTVTERALAVALGWQLGVTVPLGPRRPGYPTHYKLDVADPDRRLCVEIDGRSHAALARREADARKDERLAALGWRVLRVSTAAVLADPSAVAALVRRWADA